MALKGIDVSYSQKNIDWNKVKSQVDFAILRSSFGLDLQGQIDSQYFQNASGCVKNNIPFGIYHFGYFEDEETAKKEADFAIRMADEYKQYVKFIALDLQEDSERYAKSVGKSPNWGKCAILFLEKVKAAGYLPIIYTNVDWMENKLGGYNNMKAYKIWFAGPGAKAPKYDAAIWQYSWTGKVNGILGGDVDMDYLYDGEILKAKNTKASATKISDKDKFLNQARTYIGKDGKYVCKIKLGLGAVYDWCAFSISAIMKDCGFIGKYQGGIYSFASDNARNDNGKYGEWFLKGKKTPSPGDLIMFKYASFTNPIDKYSASHIGIVEKVEGNTITTLEGNVDGYGADWAGTSSFKRKTRYLNNSDVYSFFRIWWDGKKTATSSGSSNTTTKPTTSTSTSSTAPDIYYQVYAGGRWLPEVKNLEDYAGLENQTIQGIYMRTTKGHIRYRVKTVDSQNYLPWVYDRNDYAGIIGKNIAWVQATLEGVNGYQVEYRVSTTASTNYLPWVTNYNTVNDDGYAGGKSNQPIDKLQIKIVKK